MKQLEETNILVVGDIMLDKYVVGDVERISPEAPVPIVHIKEEYSTLGGCGNVVRNLRELGCEVDCLASIAADNYGDEIIEQLNEIGARSLLFLGSKQTTVKERIIADQRKVQMLRIDREEIKPIESILPIDILTRMTAGNPKYDMIVVSDYAKGMISSGLMSFLKREAEGKIIVDPKPINTGMYNGVFMVTPNEKEWQQMMFSSAYTLDRVKYILETKGRNGMRLIDNEFDTIDEITSIPVAVSNVSGCGDVVVSVTSLCIAMGYDALTSSKIANKCAGFTASLPGTSIITKEKFYLYMEEILNDKKRKNI